MIGILKICAVGIAAIIVISIVKEYKPEFTIEVLVCASVIMLIYVLDSLKIGFAFMENLYSKLSSGKEYFPIILKVLAIAYATEFTSSICEDANEQSIASKVQLAGKISIFFVALPIFTSLINLLDTILT